MKFYMFFSSGGIGRYTHELASTLNRMPEVDVEVACTPDYLWKNSPNYASWPGLMRISHPIPLLRRARFLQGQFVNPVRFLNHAADRQADVVHFCNINHISYPWWHSYLNRADLRVAVTAHDIRRRRIVLSRALEEKGLRAFYRRADAIFVHSDFQANELIDFAEVRDERIHVVPHGPYPYGKPTADKDAIRRRLQLPEDRDVALFFGHIRDDKNLDLLIKSLNDSRVRTHLVIAGRSASRNRPVSEYQQLVKDLGLESRVTFIPRYIRDEEIGDLFAMADWVALPYRKEFTSQSGVLNVAAHYDRPVLVGPSPVLTETLEQVDIGVICHEDSISAVAEGIVQLVDRLRCSHRHAFGEYRRAFSWQQNADETLKVYDRLLSSDGSSEADAP